MKKNETSAGGIVFKICKPINSLTRKPVLWLICQHSQHKGWIFPKGLIGDHDKKESMEAAALREVQEEGGVTAKIVNHSPVTVLYSYQWRNSPHGGTKGEQILVNKTVHYFLMEYVSGDPKNHDWEMSDAKFVTEDEIKKTLTYPSDKEAFERMLKLPKNRAP